MSANEYNARIQDYILQKFPLAKKQKFDQNTPLLESGLLDSLGILDVVSFVEKEFLIVLSDDDLTPENFQTVGHLAAFLSQQKKQ